VHNKVRRILPEMAMGKAVGPGLVPERIETTIHAVPKIFQPF
jgi:hypothetical protein